MLSLMACVMSARMGTAARPFTQLCASEIFIPESYPSLSVKGQIRILHPDRVLSFVKKKERINNIWTFWCRYWKI
jgi:hypothetical protein